MSPSSGEPPRVSIVIPTFKSAAYLRSTVDSVRVQTFHDWELILADDGSDDGTVAVIDDLVADDSRISVVKGGHAGPVVTRMNGLRRSDPRSEFVIFMDHDDAWEADALTVLVAALESAPECAAAYGLARGTDMDCRPFENDDLADSMRTRVVIRNGRYAELEAGSRTPFEAMLLKNCVASFGTALIRRSALHAVGALAPSTVPCDDWDLFIRLARRSDLLLVDHIILNWRRHSDALSNTSKRWTRSCLVVRARTLKCHENLPRHRRAALEALLTDCRVWRREMVAGVRHGRPRDIFRALVFFVVTHSMYARFRWLGRQRHRAAAVALT
jgi:glycosyltransferase involved in cell wall biosynthesis